MRLAVLADIHGNLPAFEAVCDELHVLQPDFVLLNGDLINPVPFSGEVVDRVRKNHWAVVRGNHEYYLLDFGSERAPETWTDRQRWGSLHWLVQHFTTDQVNFLAALPDERTLYFPNTQAIRAAHGVPGRNRVGFYPDMPAEQILPEITSIPERTLISAHTHVQIDRHLSLTDSRGSLPDPHEESTRYEDGYAAERCAPSEHWHLVNPGSVGLPLNKDSRAQFAILQNVPEHEEPGGWKVTHHRVKYDRRPALEAFHTSGLMEMGGVIAHLFYWELITAQPEIRYYFQWCRDQGRDPEDDMKATMAAYANATGRDRYVAARNPLSGEKEA